MGKLLIYGLAALTAATIAAAAQTPAEYDLEKRFKPLSGVADLEERFRNYVTVSDGLFFIRDPELTGTWHAVPLSSQWQIICGTVVPGIQVVFGAKGSLAELTLAHGAYNEAECRAYSQALARLLGAH